MAQSILDYYTNDFSEDDRLTDPYGDVEWVRTIDILIRFLPHPPLTVLDIGGGTGRYAAWLRQRGYEVYLIDVVPRHVEIAKKRIGAVESTIDWSAELGDARNLRFANSSIDTVLLLGPLYHLPDVTSRMAVLANVHRVLKPTGIVFAAAISKFVSFIDGLSSGFIHDDAFRNIVADDIETSRHRNPTGRPEYFMDAYFYHPFELEEEMTKAGFNVDLLAIESVLWAAQDLDRLKADAPAWQAALDTARRVEADRSIIGASPHIMAIGRKV